MKLKLDENLGGQLVARLRALGHDVHTIHDEAMAGASDEVFSQKCRRERRVLVSLDLDFANPLKYRPSRYYGIAVIRIARQNPRASLNIGINTLAAALQTEEIVGKLWIVESGRIRVYQEQAD